MRAQRQIQEEHPVTPAFVEGDGDLLPVWSILWVGSVARVVAGLVARERPGIEATLALLCVVAVPWIALAPWIQRWLGQERDGPREP
jgi:hypothetical protein